MCRARVNDGLRDIYMIMIVNERKNEKRRTSTCRRRGKKPRGEEIKARAMQFTSIPLIARHRYDELEQQRNP